MDQSLEADLSAPTYVRLRERMRADIAGGVWQLGRHVTLAELVGHYGVGMNPVREALLQLQGEGVIEMRAHRGAMIPRITAKEIADIYDVRSAIEIMLVGLAAQTATRKEALRLGELAEEHAARALAGDVPGAIRANRAFHHAVNAIARNDHALAVLVGRSSLVDALRKAIGYGPGRLGAVIEQHRAIVAAITGRDPASAQAAMAEHTKAAKADLIARLAEHETSKEESTP